MTSVAGNDMLILVTDAARGGGLRRTFTAQVNGKVLVPGRAGPHGGRRR